MRILVVLLLVCLFAGNLCGQSPNATVTGSITDPVKDVVANAKVTLVNQATNITYTSTTNEAGNYYVAELPPGTYRIAVERAGFRSILKPGVVLHVQDAVEINFEMQVGSVSESVTVEAGVPQVALASSEISGVVNDKEVANLPLNGRDWTTLAVLQPAVNEVLTQQPAGTTAHRGTRGNGIQMSISGTRPQENNYRIDGISVVDYSGGGPGSVVGAALGVDAVAEFSVITSNYDAEFGRTAGGIVNAITKSGTNQIHGDVYEYIRNSDLDAVNFFATGKPTFRRNQFGAAVGGPVQKDKTFIFADYEGFRQNLAVSFSDIVPSMNARNGIIVNTNGTTSNITVDPGVAPYLAFWPLPNHGLIGSGNTGMWLGSGSSLSSDDFGTARVDRKLAQNDALSGTYLYDRGLGDQADALDTVLTGNTSSRELIALSETHTFNSTLVNTFRAGLSEVHSNDSEGLSAINSLAGEKTLGSFPQTPAPSIAVSGITTFAGGVGGIGVVTHNWASIQLYDDAYKTKGNHTFKFGFAFERMRSNFVAAFRPNGSFTFGSLENFLENQPTTFQGGVPGGILPHGLRQSLFGGYFQDDWKVRSSLTLNLGLRYEAVTVPTDNHNRLVNLPTFSSPTPHLGSPYFSNPTLHNFEPRVGLAWDPFHNGKTAIRAAFGIFDILPLALEFQQSLNTQYPFELTIFATSLPQGTFPTGAATLATVGATNTQATASIQSNPPRNYAMTWNLDVERQLTPTISMMIGYVGNHGVHMLNREDDVNQVLPVGTTPEGYFIYPFPAGSGTKINPNWGDIRGLYWNGDAEYDGLQSKVTMRVSHGVQLGGSFTWQKAIDEGSASLVGDPFTNSISSLDYFCKLCRRGVADFNVGKTLVINYVWDLPGPVGWGGFADHTLSGWQVGGIFTAETGLPVTPLIGGDPLGTLSTDPYDYPNRVGGPGCESLVNPDNVKNYVNLNCFAVPMATPDIAAQCTPFSAVPGSCSNIVRVAHWRNILNGPGITNLDFSLVKNNYIRRISENFNVQFRFEIFNMANHPNFATPVDNETLFGSNGAPLAGAGSIDQTSTTQREIQFALKLIW